MPNVWGLEGGLRTDLMKMHLLICKPPGEGKRVHTPGGYPLSGAQAYAFLLSPAHSDCKLIV